MEETAGSMLSPWRLQIEQMHTNFSVFILFNSHRKFNLALTYSCPQMLFIRGWPLCKYFLWLDPTYFFVSQKRMVTFWLSLLTHSTRKHPQLSEWNRLAHQERAHTTFPVASMSITIGKTYTLTVNLPNKWHQEFSAHCNEHLTILRCSCKMIPV